MQKLADISSFESLGNSQPGMVYVDNGWVSRAATSVAQGVPFLSHLWSRARREQSTNQTRAFGQRLGNWWRRNPMQKYRMGFSDYNPGPFISAQLKKINGYMGNVTALSNDMISNRNLVTRIKDRETIKASVREFSSLVSRIGAMSDTITKSLSDAIATIRNAPVRQGPSGDGQGDPADGGNQGEPA